jgi:hypothetical protein
MPPVVTRIKDVHACANDLAGERASKIEPNLDDLLNLLKKKIENGPF